MGEPTARADDPTPYNATVGSPLGCPSAAEVLAVEGWPLDEHLDIAHA